MLSLVGCISGAYYNSFGQPIGSMNVQHFKQVYQDECIENSDEKTQRQVPASKPSQPELECPLAKRARYSNASKG